MRVPPGIEHPAITKAAAHHAEVVRQRDEAKAALQAAKRGRPSAVTADRDAYADALAAKQKDPGEKHTKQADEAIHQADRKLAALEKATTDAAQGITAAVQEHGEAIAASLRTRLAAVDEEYAEAVDAWEEAAQTRGEVLAALQWIARGDTTRSTPKVGGWVPGLRPRQPGTDQPPAGFAEVAGALRGVLTPPDRPEPQAVAGSAAAFLGVEPGGA